MRRGDAGGRALLPALRHAGGRGRPPAIRCSARSSPSATCSSRRSARAAPAPSIAASTRRCKKRVAVKVLHAQLSTDDTALERFRREATTVAEIDNEHILQVIDFGRTDDERLFFAMEFLEGETADQAARAREAALRRARRRHPDADRRGADGGARARLRPSRSAAAQRLPHQPPRARRLRQAARLRARQADPARRRGQADGDRHDLRRSALHVARAGARRDARSTRRHLFARRHRLRDADRRAALRRRRAPSRSCSSTSTRRCPRCAIAVPTVRAWLDAAVQRALAKKPDGRFVTVAKLLESLRGQAAPAAADAAEQAEHARLSSERPSVTSAQSSGAQASAPPVQSSASPPAQSSAPPPVQSSAPPPVQSSAPPPVQSSAAPPVQSSAAPPVQSSAAPPVQQSSAPPPVQSMGPSSTLPLLGRPPSARETQLLTTLAPRARPEPKTPADGCSGFGLRRGHSCSHSRRDQCAIGGRRGVVEREDCRGSAGAAPAGRSQPARLRRSPDDGASGAPRPSPSGAPSKRRADPTGEWFSSDSQPMPFVKGAAAYDDLDEIPRTNRGPIIIAAVSGGAHPRRRDRDRSAAQDGAQAAARRESRGRAGAGRDAERDCAAVGCGGTAVQRSGTPSGTGALPPSGTPSGASASPSGASASPSGASASPSGASASPSGASASPSGAAGAQPMPPPLEKLASTTREPGAPTPVRDRGRAGIQIDRAAALGQRRETRRRGAAAARRQDAAAARRQNAAAARRQGAAAARREGDGQGARRARPRRSSPHRRSRRAWRRGADSRRSARREAQEGQAARGLQGSLRRRRAQGDGRRAPASRRRPSSSSSSAARS